MILSKCYFFIFFFWDILLLNVHGHSILQCIASTTTDEYRMHLEKDKAFGRRFQPVWINEPSQVSFNVFFILLYVYWSVVVQFIIRYGMKFLG